MLESLHISNYALIDRVDITFHPGLNIITGETGAGKSIMLGALSLLLGARADTKAVRDKDMKSVIEASFTVGDCDRTLKQYCLANDIEWDDVRCILRREITPAGRSRAFINDSPVPLNRLSDVDMRLIDIHSQHQNQLLSQGDFQLKVLDTLAHNSGRMSTFASRYQALREALKKLKSMKLKIQQTRDDEEFTRFQLEQLDRMNLRAGEQEELERDRDVAENITTLKENLEAASNALSEGTVNIMDLLTEVTDAVAELEDILDEKEQIGSRLDNIRIELQDIADTIADTDRNLAGDPGDLDRIDQRLNDIYAMERKHRVESVNELIEIRERLRDRLETLEDADLTLADLEKDARRAMALAKETAQELTVARKEAAKGLEEQIITRATPLGMKNLRCEIKVDATDMSSTGCDAIDFTFAFNKNQPLLPVGNSASGGEISRLMLSLKAILAHKMSLPSIIFDEVDTGVSGDVANRMGLMMSEISGSIQVIAITHLPQVAAKGTSHFKVYKEDDDTSTHTRITELNASQRVGEIALMLSGNPSDPTALAAARTLLDGGADTKS